MARIVFATLGTLGDLHPSMAIARTLASRGHSTVIASHPGYRARVEAAGLAFAPMRPDIDANDELGAVMEQAMDEKTGSEFVVRKLILPNLRISYDDALVACEGADAVVTHMLAFAAGLAAEVRGIPRFSTVLQPMAMLSAYEPPVGPSMPAASFVRRLGPGVWKLIWALGRTLSRGWFREVDELRASLGLPASPRNPLFEHASPLLNLALFPRALGEPQPDWPRNTVVTGMCMYDRDEQGGGMPESLRGFLGAGDPPIVFTLGSSGVWSAGDFYASAATAAASIGKRAVLLVGPRAEARPATLPAGCIAIDYAPHSELLPRAIAIVHHGGVGTTGQAMASGRPMVFVPFSHDQPDNAERCERLGIARTVPRSQVSVVRLAAALREVIENPAYATRASAIGERVRAEDGARTAADAIERALAAQGMDHPG